MSSVLRCITCIDSIRPCKEPVRKALFKKCFTDEQTKGVLSNTPKLGAMNPAHRRLRPAWATQ
jgi:hypothetical protein